MPEGRWFSEQEVRAVVAESRSYAEVLRRLGLRAAWGNHGTIRKYVEDVWRIPVDHFERRGAHLCARPPRAVPLADVLVEGSTYHRGHLKRRLLAEGLKRPECEMCGQGEIWRGRRMSLVLDHINGVHDDHRLENLRLLCPNCNATLDTHCGRNTRLPQAESACLRCGAVFLPRSPRHRYCSRACGQRAPGARTPRPAARRAERPPYEQLISEIETLGYAAVGRRYGVSDNAIRKWRRAYEAEAARTTMDGPAPAPTSL
jgi:HNH endonuclease